MNIVIFVDYSSSNFNKDFDLSDMLKIRHNVFFAINQHQLDYLAPNCDVSVLGYSGKKVSNDFDLKLSPEIPTQEAVKKIEQIFAIKQNNNIKNA